MVVVTGNKFSYAATMQSHYAFVSAFANSVGYVTWCALHSCVNTVKDQLNENILPSSTLQYLYPTKP